MSTSTVKVNHIPVSEDSPFPVTLQSFLLTDPTNNNSRLRVDVGQTGFFAGREFRTFKEFNLTAGNLYVIKVIANVNTILFDLSISLVNGDIKLYTIVGGTEGGTFSETLPVLPRNTMTERPTPYYTPQNTIVAGGTLSVGTTIDLVWLKTTDNTNKATNISDSFNSERGVSPGTYYFKIEAITNSSGVIQARWEERP